MYLTTSSNRYSFSNWVYDVTLRLTNVTIIQRMASLHHIHANFYTTLGIFLCVGNTPEIDSAHNGSFNDSIKD